MQWICTSLPCCPASQQQTAGQHQGCAGLGVCAKDCVLQQTWTIRIQYKLSTSTECPVHIETVCNTCNSEDVAVSAQAHISPVHSCTQHKGMLACTAHWGTAICTSDFYAVAWQDVQYVTLHAKQSCCFHTQEGHVKQEQTKQGYERVAAEAAGRHAAECVHLEGQPA